LKEMYDREYPNTKIAIETILQEFKRCGLTYEKTFRKNYQKGVFVGVRFKTIEDRQREQQEQQPSTSGYSGSTLAESQ
jgi:hypothetical protein